MQFSIRRVRAHGTESPHNIVGQSFGYVKSRQLKISESTPCQNATESLGRSLILCKNTNERGSKTWLQMFGDLTRALVGTTNRIMVGLRQTHSVPNCLHGLTPSTWDVWSDKMPTADVPVP